MEWIELNNKVLSENGEANPQHDIAAMKSYFENKVNPNTVFFHDLEEKLEYMVSKGFWDKSVVNRLPIEQIKEVFNKAYSIKFRFKSFMGAYKFYNEYATKTPDGTRWLERYEDRMAITALTHSQTFDEAMVMVEHLTNQTFTPATPTLLNSGKTNSGRLVSCFLLQDMTDNLDSIMKTIGFIAELSKGGGGIGFDASNLRAKNESLRNIDSVTKGIGGVAKMVDNTLRYADQAGQRQGAGVVYVHILHPDVLDVMSSKKPAADEDKRLKTLSIGISIPDVFYNKLKLDEEMFHFYPHSIFKETGREFTDIDWDTEYEAFAANDNIRKVRFSPRKLLEEIAIAQGESGYPYILNLGNANRANPIPNVGSIKMSNLC